MSTPINNMHKYRHPSNSKTLQAFPPTMFQVKGNKTIILHLKPKLCFANIATSMIQLGEGLYTKKELPSTFRPLKKGEKITLNHMHQIVDMHDMLLSQELNIGRLNKNDLAVDAIDGEVIVLTNDWHITPEETNPKIQAGYVISQLLKLDLIGYNEANEMVKMYNQKGLDITIDNVNSLEHYSLVA